MLRTVSAVRYVTPLREGGSLPALVEADDDGLYSPRHRFLEARTILDAERLRLLDPDLDLDAVRAHLTLIEQVAAGEPTAGPIAGLDRSERFGWITSPSSTAIQPSPVHTGLCDDPSAMLEHLYASLVAPPGGR